MESVSLFIQERENKHISAHLCTKRRGKVNEKLVRLVIHRGEAETGRKRAEMGMRKRIQETAGL